MNFGFIAFLMSVMVSASGADISAGKLKAEGLCNACHGPNGNSQNADIPSLAGMPALSIANTLFYYREGNRKNPIMTPIASTLSNAEMKDLAAYYASQAREVTYKSKPENIELGAKLAQQYNCTQCHGPNLLGVQHIPRIAGQNHDYLLTQLKGFKAMTRADMDGNMSSAVSAIKLEDLVLISDYVAGLKFQ
ncbi:c-type cytochrome [Polynucleobacter kasalickyi]|nr:c-type cytochrome [Polynucleobacter kasalickyi]